jgi:hypothetical protein
VFVVREHDCSRDQESDLDMGDVLGVGDVGDLGHPVIAVVFGKDDDRDAR